MTWRYKPILDLYTLPSHIPDEVETVITLMSQMWEPRHQGVGKGPGSLGESAQLDSLPLAHSVALNVG